MLPKLVAAVDAWDPRTEAVPIHAWIHPWLPLLGVRPCLLTSHVARFLPILRERIAKRPVPSASLQDRMMPLYAPIRHKLSSALGAWHPGDGSALALLAPWRRVFADSDWESLLARCILPKLGWALSQLVVNPADQQLEPLQWALAWAEAVPARHMATLLEQVRSAAGTALAHISPVLIRPSPCRPQSFFPKWHAVLHAWLSAAPNFDEVTRWYLGWKGLFPEEARAPTSMRQHRTCEAAVPQLRWRLLTRMLHGAGAVARACAARLQRGAGHDEPGACARHLACTHT